MWAVDLQVRINGSYMATGRLWFSILVHKPKRLTASIMNLVSWQRNLTYNRNYVCSHSDVYAGKSKRFLNKFTTSEQSLKNSK